MARVTRCVGTLVRPCPDAVTWEYRGNGAPRKRCATCAVAEHNDSTALNKAVKAGASEASALVDLMLREARRLLSVGRRADAMRLTQRAMQGPVSMNDRRPERAILEPDGDHSRSAAPVPTRRAPPTPNIQRSA